jgi:anti-sigma regulatory factor (Ser/Thr protein kinase)
MPSPPWHTTREPDAVLTCAEPFAPVQLRLPADASELARARQRVTAAASEFGFSHKAGYEFVFAVNEAVTNAIKHGHPAADGTIGLYIEADGDTLVCSVCDSGPFRRRLHTRDMASADGGRGFAFMSALTDDVELTVEPEATIVTLRKRLRDDDA